jgi:hypothetical protein
MGDEDETCQWPAVARMNPMTGSTPTTRFRFWLWLIRLVSMIVPQRLRADWRQE